jgi:hypothetical protein
VRIALMLLLVVVLSMLLLVALVDVRNIAPRGVVRSWHRLRGLGTKPLLTLSKFHLPTFCILLLWEGCAGQRNIPSLEFYLFGDNLRYHWLWVLSFIGSAELTIC